MKLKFLYLLPVVVLTFCQAPNQDEQEETINQPNFLFILVDDLGWADVGAFGSSFYETPNIDRLAASGMMFTQAYAASPVCSPTRSSIMTGKNPARTQHTTFFGGPKPGDMNPDHWMWFGYHRMLEPATYLDRLEHSDTTLAEALKEGGYKTFFAGKWHLGRKKYFPETHGFDINVGGIHKGGPYGGKNYFSPYDNPKLPDGPEREHLPDRLARETNQFIEANKDSTFLAYLSFYSVHTPLMTRMDLLEKYQKKRDSLGLTDEIVTDPSNPNQKIRVNQSHATYAGMVETMDEAVGKVLDKLDELGLAENTAVFFMSDNGGLSAPVEFATSNLPLRAGKGWAYEGGIREPMIVRWPGETAPGSTCEVPVISTDFYPTMLDIAGIPPKPKQHVDGKSFVPLLTGNSETHETLLGWHFPHYAPQGETPFTVYREGDWKLIYRYETNEYELYDIPNDISESNNLIEKEREKAEELKKAMKAWLDESDARYPTPNPDYEG